jgi:hypothetical protein
MSNPITLFAVLRGEGTPLPIPFGGSVTIKAHTRNTNGSLTVLEFVHPPKEVAVTFQPLAIPAERLFSLPATAVDRPSGDERRQCPERNTQQGNDLNGPRSHGFYSLPRS